MIFSWWSCLLAEFRFRLKKMEASTPSMAITTTPPTTAPAMTPVLLFFCDPDAGSPLLDALGIAEGAVTTSELLQRVARLFGPDFDIVSWRVSLIYELGIKN
jgi:hypothetical protein